MQTTAQPRQHNLKGIDFMNSIGNTTYSQWVLDSIIGSVLLVSLLLAANIASAQKDVVLFEINGEPVYTSEFQ